jgi:hypothetical protein
MTTATATASVVDLIQQFCDVLRCNYQSFCMENHHRAIENVDNAIALAVPNGTVDDHIAWHRDQIDKLSEGEGVDEFVYTKGRKYAKIIHITSYGNKSVHAFVDLNNGDVFKPATWQQPAKGIRYNLIDEDSRTAMYQRADWAGAYLYR